jgi:hypothetical protein
MLQVSKRQGAKLDFGLRFNRRFGQEKDRQGPLVEVVS